MPEVSACYLVSRLISAKMTSASWIIVHGLQNLLLHLLISYPLPLSFCILLLFTITLDVEEDAIFKKDFIWELPDGSFPSIRTSLRVSFCFVAQILKDFVVRNWISLRHHSIVIYTILQVKWQRIKYFDTLKLLPAIAEHFRGPERLRGRATVPGGTIPLADTFRGNKYASGFVPPEQWRGGTNPLWHRYAMRYAVTWMDVVWRASPFTGPPD